MMKIEDAIRIMRFMRNGYQKLIDEDCSEGDVVGTDVTGTWKSDTPLTEVYQKHIDACDMAIETLKKQIPKKFKMVDDTIPTCPVCGEEVWDMDWCNSCGQRIGDEVEDHV